MASQQRFEGPVLEDLLDRVRAEAGPGAQIVAANRVRKGGLGGFFTREYFEVVVDIADIELDDEPDTYDEVPAPRRFGRATRGAPGATAAAAAAANTAAALATQAQAHVPSANTTRKVPASILDLAEAVNNSERRRPAQHAPNRQEVIDLVDDTPAVSTESSRFASILERISHEVDAVSNRGVLDEDEDDITVEHRTPILPPAPVAPATHAEPEEVPFDPPRFVRPSEIAEARTTQGNGLAEEVRERLQQSAGAARRTATAARVTADADTEDAAPLVQPTAFGALTDDPVQPAVFRRVPRTEAVIERPETALARLGLPARLVPRGASRGELRGALIESLSDLPAVPALPNANGVVIAVVGKGASAVLLARELCAEYGLDAERIVLATEEPLGAGIPAWLQICDAPTAEERRRSWRRRPLPTIVAVNLGADRNGLTWAREILDQLEPTLAWSIIDAGWKSEDTRDWIERLGGVDALALTNVDNTVSPASPLDLGVPVGRIEGKPATPIAWAELLLARMQ